MREALLHKRRLKSGTVTADSSPSVQAKTRLKGNKNCVLGVQCKGGEHLRKPFIDSSVVRLKGKESMKK